MTGLTVLPVSKTLTLLGGSGQRQIRGKSAKSHVGQGRNGSVVDLDVHVRRVCRGMNGPHSSDVGHSQSGSGSAGGSGTGAIRYFDGDARDFAGSGGCSRR